MSRRHEHAGRRDAPADGRLGADRSPDEPRGTYPGPADTAGKEGHSDPRNSSTFPTPPADETGQFCENCGRPMEAGSRAHCDDCRAQGRHRGRIEVDQLAEPHAGASQSGPEQADHSLPPAEQAQAIALGIDPAVLDEAAGDPERSTESHLTCPECGERTRHVVDRYLTTLEEAAETPAGRLTDPCAKRRQRELGAASLQCTTPGCTHTQPRGPRPQPQ